MLASVGVGLRHLGIIAFDIDKPPLAVNVSGRPICYNGGLGVPAARCCSDFRQGVRADGLLTDSLRSMDNGK